jgi:ribosome-binding protein aMBF1 (putative translation factor)
MIENKKQYGISKNWAKKFKAALHNLEQHKDQFHPRSYQAQKDGLLSQLADLEREIADFEALQNTGAVVDPKAIESLPQQLIRARVAAGLTQSALAQKLGMKEQLIQRYEATKYASASLRRILEVARVLEKSV